jgi:hypothetical protein
VAEREGFYTDPDLSSPIDFDITRRLLVAPADAAWNALPLEYHYR